jgi:hypothetical protein
MTGWGEWEGAIGWKNAIMMKLSRGPTELAGGYRLRLLGRDRETGDWLEMGGGVFPNRRRQEREMTLTPRCCKAATGGRRRPGKTLWQAMSQEPQTKKETRLHG